MNNLGLDRIFIAGPTAIGKSEVALVLAEQVGGEIITVDSMQVYRGMDIGTAKPSQEERERIPHHLLNVVGLDEAFDAARFCELAKEVEQSIQKNKRVPIFCGGTGLYFKAYLGGLGAAPPSDSALRQELESAALPDLLLELQTSDPATFESIDQKNPRRVIRAVEVIRLTGKPMSTQRSDWSTAQQPRGLIALSREPGDLRRRIDERVDLMFECGLLEEVRQLLDKGLAQNRTAMQALGYRQVAEHFEGKRGLEETVELVKIRTWQFARRQMNWFRRQLKPDWLHVPPDELAFQTAHRVQERFSLI